MLLMTLTMILLFSRVSLNHDGTAVSQEAQCHKAEPEATKLNSALINFIIYTCAFTTVTSQNSTFKAP